MRVERWALKEGRKAPRLLRDGSVRRTCNLVTAACKAWEARQELRYSSLAKEVLKGTKYDNKTET